MTARFKINTKVTARFSDLDAMGHVNNARFFSYMEEGRVAYFNKLFPDKSLLNQFDIFPFILADIQCTFKSPIMCSETIIVSLGVIKIGTKSLTMEYDLTEEKSGRQVATGSSVLVMYDYKTKTTCSVSTAIKNRIHHLEND